jgi:hypothetical protein
MKLDLVTDKADLFIRFLYPIGLYSLSTLGAKVSLSDFWFSTNNSYSLWSLLD